MTPSQYRDFKTLTKPGDNLRDHMTDLELIFTMLGEASTTEIARNRDVRGFTENKEAAVEGGNVAGSTRKDLERRSGEKVIIPNAKNIADFAKLFDFYHKNKYLFC